PRSSACFRRSTRSSAWAYDRKTRLRTIGATSETAWPRDLNLVITMWRAIAPGACGGRSADERRALPRAGAPKAQALADDPRRTWRRDPSGFVCCAACRCAALEYDRELAPG